MGRIARELATLRAMIGIACRGRHGTRDGLCGACAELWRYAAGRVERCPFRAGKPACRRCRVHCFAPDRREEIRAVMRYAGPRMLCRHPLLALLHLLAGRRRPPGREGGRGPVPRP